MLAIRKSAVAKFAYTITFPTATAACVGYVSLRATDTGVIAGLVCMLSLGFGWMLKDKTARVAFIFGFGIVAWTFLAAAFHWTISGTEKGTVVFGWPPTSKHWAVCWPSRSPLPAHS